MLDPHTIADLLDLHYNGEQKNLAGDVTHHVYTDLQNHGTFYVPVGGCPFCALTAHRERHSGTFKEKENE